MVGDVNIFLTDPTDPSLAELEIMIAGDAQRLCPKKIIQKQRFIRHLQSNLCFDFYMLNISLINLSVSTLFSCNCVFNSLTLMTFLVFNRAQLQRQGHRERGDAHDDVLR